MQVDSDPTMTPDRWLRLVEAAKGHLAKCIAERGRLRNRMERVESDIKGWQMTIEAHQREYDASLL